MFIKELTLNIDYMMGQIRDVKVNSEKVIREITSFGNQLLSGIQYYRDRSEKILKQSKETFLHQLDSCEQRLNILILELATTASKND